MQVTPDVRQRAVGFGFLAAALLFLSACSDPQNQRVVDEPADLHPIPAQKSNYRVDEPVLLTGDLELPENVTLVFSKRGRLILAPGVTLTVLGPMKARDDQWIFELQDESASIVAPQLDTVHPHWWGARGNGIANDSRALRLTAAFVNRRGGGTISFLPGTYLVGEQRLAGAFGLGCSYCTEPLLRLVDNEQPVVIEGNGAVMRAEEGLHFGAFDPVTGLPYEPTLPFYDQDYAAHAYWGMIELIGNHRVEVRDFELDGSIDSLVLGGRFGDVDWQLAAYGIRAYNNENVEIERIYTHHHGLDGLVIGYTGLTETDPPKPHRLSHIRSEYNARQGLSWVGGNDLIARDCNFSHTGRAGFWSSPGAGLDIEAEEAVVRNGLFERCAFVDNVRVGMVADSGDGGYTTFRDSLFWGTTHWAIWPNKPRLRFENCVVYGSVVRAYWADDPADRVSFHDCYFEDVQGAEYPVWTSPAGLIELDAENLLIEDSIVVANRTRGIWIDGTTSRETLRNVAVLHRYDGVPDGSHQSLIRGVTLENVVFGESFPTQGQQRWYIAVEHEVCDEVLVTGPQVRWKNPVSGVVGKVCESGP